MKCCWYASIENRPSLRLADILNSTIGDDKVSRDKVRLKFDAFIRILRVISVRSLWGSIA